MQRLIIVVSQSLNREKSRGAGVGYGVSGLPGAGVGCRYSEVDCVGQFGTFSS